MKIIHTSDWHLGQNFFGYDRSKDHEAMIEQLVKLVQEEKPDALKCLQILVNNGADLDYVCPYGFSGMSFLKMMGLVK